MAITSCGEGLCHSGLPVQPGMATMKRLAISAAFALLALVLIISAAIAFV
jgi:hypothetical protein